MLNMWRRNWWGGSAGGASRLALPLTTDTSILTAVGNDYGFDRVFARQIEALANPGDVVVGISTSGNSPNVLGVEAAERREPASWASRAVHKGGWRVCAIFVLLHQPACSTSRSCTLMLGISSATWLRKS